MLETILNKFRLRLYRYLPTDEDFIKIKYKVVFSKDLNLLNPQTFNAKINWIICNYRNPLYELCSDKVDARAYVSSKGLARHLTKLYAVYESVDDIDFTSLPDKFVIKPTNSNGGVSVVGDKSIANFEEIRRNLIKSLSKNLYVTSREWQYKNLAPRIMVEEYIEPANNEPLLEYKFYCFDGEPRYISVSSDVAKGGSYEMDFYDTKWNHLDIQRVGYFVSNGSERPIALELMLKIAKTLSAEFPHVRVDLYNVHGKIYIGELTFTTAAGAGRFINEKSDYELGKYFNLPLSGTEILSDRFKS